MCWMDQDKDAFDPKVVRRNQETRDRCRGNTSPSGKNYYCERCGLAMGMYAIPGCCCPHCNCTVKNPIYK